MRLFVSLFTLMIGLLLGNALMADAHAHVEGYVTDFITDTPIPNATITFVSDSGQVIIKKTDALGFYSFASVSPGQATMIYEADGYQTQRKSVKLQNTGTTRIDCQLYPKGAAPGIIAGQVTDAASGAEIQGATLQLFLGGVLLETVTSEIRGVYLFLSRPADSYVVTVTANGYQSASKGALISTGATTIIDFALDHNPGSVSGIVADSGDNRLAGINISIITNGVTIQSTTTNALGEYSVTGLAPGNYEVWATSNDYQSAYAGVTIIAGQTGRAYFKLNLQPGDLNGNVRDNNGNPLQNALLTVFLNNVKVAFFQSDASGDYVFQGLSPGSYAITAQLTGYKTQTLGTTILSGLTSTVDFTLSPNPGDVIGTVSNSAGTPIEGALVTVALNNIQMGFVLTDKSGKYTFQHLTPGSYAVTAFASGYRGGNSGGIVVSDQTTAVNFSLGTNPGIIAGHVQDSNGTPLSGVFIQADMNGIIAGQAITDNWGYYTIPGTSPGSYQVIANLSGYQTGIGGVTVTADQTSTADFTLITNPGDIVGSVLNPGLSPISGAQVKISLNNIELGSALTDNAGHYSFSGLPPGTYMITSSALGYRTGFLGGNVSSNQTSTFNFLLPPIPGDIIGNVSDAKGKPLSGVLIEVIFNGVNTSAILTDNDGNYAIPGLAPGSYQVNAAAAGYQSQFIGGDLQAGQTTRVDFVLIPKPGIIFGNVSEFGGTVISGSIVTASLNGVAFASVMTDNFGNYFIFGLPPGSYTVTTSAGGYGSESLGAIVESKLSTEVNFQLNPNPGTLTGQATDENGNPLSGVFIEVNLGQFPVITAITDNNGQYYVTGLKPGSYFLYAKAAGYSTQMTGAIVISNQTAIVNFVIKANPGDIEGNVSSSKDTPIAGALITAYFKNIPTATALTDNAGNYTLSGLTSGSYTLTASAPGYGTKTVGGIVKTGKTSIVNFILKADPGAIKGKVTDNNDSPLPGVAIDIYFSNTLLASTLTDNTGRYYVAGLPPESYTVLASTPGYQMRIKNSARVDAHQTTIVNFSLNGKTSTVKGTITDAATHLPISGAIVDVIRKGQIIQTSITDNTGNYIITVIGKGDYSISANAPDHFPGETSFSIGSNETITADLALQPTLNLEASVTGEIYDCEKGKKKPVSGALVQLFQKDVFIGEAFTDNQGIYLFSPIDQGKYTLYVFASNHVPATTSFSVELDQTAKINLPLCPDNPVRNLKVKVRKNTFATQTDWIDHLTWKPVKSRSVKYYAVYLNGKLIAKVPPLSRLKYDNHDQPKGKKRVYTVIAVYESGKQNSGAKIKIK